MLQQSDGASTQSLVRIIVVVVYLSNHVSSSKGQRTRTAHSFKVQSSLKGQKSGDGLGLRYVAESRLQDGPLVSHPISCFSRSLNLNSWAANENSTTKVRLGFIGSLATFVDDSSQDSFMCPDLSQRDSSGPRSKYKYVCMLYIYIEDSVRS